MSEPTNWPGAVCPRKKSNLTDQSRGPNWQKRYLISGFLLFLLGLIAGFLPAIAENPRMALSAHMQGLLNGIFLICSGLALPHIKLSARLNRVAFMALIYGTYANFLATVLAAIWNTGLLLDIHGNQTGTHTLHDIIVAILLMTLAINMIIGVSIFLWGLIRRTNR